MSHRECYNPGDDTSRNGLLIHIPLPFPHPMTVESTPLLANGNGHARERSFVQKVKEVIVAEGEPGWIESSRFILLRSWFNVLLIFIPLALISEKLEWDAGLRFAFSFIGIIPLLLGEATEQLSMRLGQTLGGLLNASFGNAVCRENLCDWISILTKFGKPRRSKLSLGSPRWFRVSEDPLDRRCRTPALLGHVGSSPMLILLFQVVFVSMNRTSELQLLKPLVIPAAYHSSQQHPSNPPVPNAISALMETDAPGGNERSHNGLLLISRGTAIVLLIVYVSYLYFQVSDTTRSEEGPTNTIDVQLKSHADLFAAPVDEDSEPEEPNMSVISGATCILNLRCSGRINRRNSREVSYSQGIHRSYFVAIGAEHVTSVWMAMKGKLELTIGISVGSSIQIAAFVVPLLVIVSWVIGKELTLYFADFETVSLFVSVILVNLLIMDGKSNYMEALTGFTCSLGVLKLLAAEDIRSLFLFHILPICSPAFVLRLLRLDPTFRMLSSRRVCPSCRNLNSMYSFQIVAIGRNYLEHIKELGNTVPPEPFFFLKPTTIELGVVIGKTGRDISEAQADSHVAGYSMFTLHDWWDCRIDQLTMNYKALSIDMTARNMQDAVKKKGLPWSAAKGFDTFTPTSPFIPREKIVDPHNLNLWLKINGEFKQNGNTKDMMNRIPRLIQHVSSIMTLEEGDLILTGTPHGVGPVKVGDQITAGLAVPDKPDLLASLELEAVARDGGYIFKE
ncbi:calcium:hydrogen antiporter [Rhizoctonia solani AG-1 IA]|uniref:Calcium:hydrogen antiporter n=1 Tax=Thanatephorus cucumeris (strain AG1-IA) TaxID=983506 RepID=L8X659_THACA|nr:calcium:hydrogen antiporter [Rhizoctonia solani AG-1 IA]